MTLKVESEAVENTTASAVLL